MPFFSPLVPRDRSSTLCIVIRTQKTAPHTLSRHATMPQIGLCTLTLNQKKGFGGLKWNLLWSVLTLHIHLRNTTLHFDSPRLFSLAKFSQALAYWNSSCLPAHRSAVNHNKVLLIPRHFQSVTQPNNNTRRTYILFVIPVKQHNFILVSSDQRCIIGDITWGVFLLHVKYDYNYWSGITGYCVPCCCDPVDCKSFFGGLPHRSLP